MKPAFDLSCFWPAARQLRLISNVLVTILGSAAAASQVDTARVERDCCAIFELRQYTLKPDQRDVLIELFEREFVETQEAVGMRICGQFRDDDHPERFVWIRAFADMKARERGLTSFYGGPTWKAHGKQAVATMIDSDNVLLLHPVDPPGGFNDLAVERPPIGATAPPSTLVAATIYNLRSDTCRDFPAFFRDQLLPVLRESGIIPRATFATEHSPNTYPALPVREGEDVFAWFASFETAAKYAACLDRLSRSPNWAQVSSTLATHLKSPSQQLRLRPTGRSLLR